MIRLIWLEEKDVISIMLIRITYGCIVWWLLLTPQIGIGQMANHRMIPVEDLLVEAESQYQVRFSYSRDVVPYREVIALPDHQDLSEVLEVLQEQAGIIYQRRGSRVVLNYRPDEMVSRQEPERREDFAPQLSPPAEKDREVPETQDDDLGRPPREVLVEIQPIHRISTPASGHVTSSQKETKEDLERLFEEPESRLVQLSAWPVPALLDRKLEGRYHLSVNLPLGYIGHLEGLEVGFLNGVKYDVYGIQAGVIGNHAGGHTQGGQIAGMVNYNRGIMRGIQMSGFANINEQADALQLAGFVNLNQRISRGVQLAGFVNGSRHITGGQLAGFLNFSLGSLDLQAAGMLNVAETVGVQISGLVNVAKEVKEFQLGLINVADTVEGISLGLINFIRKGYNRVEFSVGDAMYANAALKMGTRRFYNIFQLSSNFKRNVDQSGLIWGYGYGVGLFRQIQEKVSFNPEILVMQIHERRLQYYDLNLVNQLRLMFAFGDNDKSEFFAGPVLNLSVSKLADIERNIYGSSVPPYTLWNQTNMNGEKPLTTKAWIGFSAGVRI